MNKFEFDKTSFFGGMKAKISGDWYDVISADFLDKTITVDDGKESVISVHFIEAFEKFRKKVTNAT